jgi:hypothetical protein
MRKLIYLALSASVLAACSAPTPPATQSTTTAEAPTVQAEVAGAAAQAFNPDFPEGVAPGFKYKIRSRKTEATADGQLRKLVIEFKEGDLASIDAKVQALLEAKGFKRYKTLEQGAERVGDYGKPGRRVTVTTTPSGAMKLDPDSLGTVYFVWTE